MDPFSYLATVKDVDAPQISRFVLDGVDQRARVSLTTICGRTRSISYAQLRSLSQQRRAAELRHGAAATPGANFYDDPSKTNSEGVPPVGQPDAQPAPAKPVDPPQKDPAQKVSRNTPPKGISFTLSVTPRSSAQSSRSPSSACAATA